ncbi:DeoR/GlpR transcriptional regulator [Phototrophicus methaneseepsis]|uniref:DeoR/GlpR transcriptional regulator n=1 Tax=Phototrophicus methaneseepsis TaxID=2710758 RepID=A0A7S8EAH4_9CHLR|nr:DeoR/GlpR family DNA-binding transcription regulator [Phototrophicus methaneseepsis]QPC83388.1 DeoR/GlpR transcriptional regulator [Phototrophicus methaneseepsis]
MSNSDLMTRERQEQIVQLLDQTGRLTVIEICDRFGISEATARRDLATLATQNLIRRVHGGAIKRQVVATVETPILQRQSEQSGAKRRIGEATAHLIGDSETLLLIGGTTGVAVARELRHHKQLTIITDSLLIANELLDHHRHNIIMLGGVIDPDERAVRGTLSRIVLQHLQVDKAIIGTKAISLERGLSVETPEEAELWRAYIETAHHIIVATDATKFNQSALVQAFPIDAIHTIVSDDTLDENHIEQLRDKGIDVIIA